MDVQRMVLELRAGGLSQSEIARRVDSTQATIWRIENGRTDPKLSLAQRIEKLHRTEAKQKKKTH